MASVNLKKGKCDRKKALYGIPKHLYRDGKNHANKDIDPSRSHLNKHYGPQTSAEFRERYREMVAECDRRKPPKRRKEDRKELMMMDIPSPREMMSPEDEAAWSAKTYEVMTELFGDQIVGATYHADEVHWYPDPHDKQEHLSRGHTHYAVIPWTDAKGLNMDAFYKRDLPNKINEALDKACMEMFGFPFRDGSQQKSRGTVEQLKVESLTARKEQLQKSVGDLRKRETAAINAVGKLDAEIEEKQKEVAELDAAKSRFKEDLTEWVDAHNGLQRVLRAAPRLSTVNRDKISTRMEQAVSRGDAVLSGALDDVDAILAAAAELERGKRVFGACKQAVKGNLDIDDLLTDDDFELC